MTTRSVQQTKTIALHCATLAVWMMTFNAGAQMPRREPTPNDTLKSPEVLPDNRVAFRIYAPKADAVTIGGDWMAQGLGKGGALTKDGEGVWSITAGPQPPDFYSYTFTVDGVRTVDPKNAMIKQGVSSQDFTLNGSKNLAEVFKKNGLKHEFNLSGGGHTWINWRHYLNDYAPRLFR